MATAKVDVRTVDILLVEDNPGDVRLTMEALKDGPVAAHLHVAHDGVEALAYVRREGEYADAVRPDLILLDLNLPRKGGHQVLAEIKRDVDLRTIPVVVLTTSQAEADIEQSYELDADCYVTKPVNLDDFLAAIHAIEAVWLAAAQPHGT